MAIVACAGCGIKNDAAPGVGGFKCTSCQRNNWVIACVRCGTAMIFWGEIKSSGVSTYRCRHCGTANQFEERRLREIAAEARRVATMKKAATQEQRRRALTDERERKAAYLAEREEEAQLKASEADRVLEELRNLLISALDSPASFTFASMRLEPERLKFEPPGKPPKRSEYRQPPTAPDERKPLLEDFLPPPPSGFGGLVGKHKRRERQVEAAQSELEAVLVQYEDRQKNYQDELEIYEAVCAEKDATFQRQNEEYEYIVNNARKYFDRKVDEANRAVLYHNNEIDQLERHYANGDPEAVADFITRLLENLHWPYAFDPVRVAFSAASKQAVVEMELPPFATTIPDLVEYHYVQRSDQIVGKSMADRERKALYASLVAQIALRAVHEIFQADSAGAVSSVVVNGHVQTTDPRTGHEIRPCLVTLRTTKDEFEQINLRDVDPVMCLRGLRAAFSRQPSDLVPVKPVVEFDMVDPRFVQEAQVLAALDNRPNLMELSPGDFESLVTNLFEKMGLETRLTQASRDGGVDCVAYDTRPIFGGKVVIQAKRYKNTVGVSAVRDLYGTMLNEGAAKGILVTTSGYGSASYDFAGDKPMELLDGANLLYLLKEHAGIDAKIEIPDDWEDPILSS